MENKNAKPTISVIIRTKNEEKYLGQVLEMIKQQTYQNFEIIIVDDHSSDKTLEIAKSYGCKIITMPKDQFSHPRSCNIGAENASGKYPVYLNGHSIPISIKFLEDGLKNFENEKVAGIYSIPLAHKHSTLADKVLYNIAGYTIGMIKYRIKKFAPGLLGTTNAMLRKKLWEEYKFNENLNNGWGGEDSEWAWHFIKLGYVIIHDPKFKARHSHHLKFKDLFWQLNNWRKMIAGGDNLEKQRKNF
ncbi:MAG: glycosyltransferase family A protein [Patescibacteria group bacterium]|nr:glycosyltransferase family A protein [Patescibacteria group bacterium]